MCGNNKTTTTASSSPSAYDTSALNATISQAEALYANNPSYVPYSGVGVAPTTAEQNTGISNINNYAFSAQPNLNAATNTLTAAVSPLTQQQIQTYMSPYTQDVENTTAQQFANQNALALQAVQGNAVTQDALGGNREAIAQGITAGQMETSEAPVLAGIENTGYNAGLSTAEQEYQTNPEAAAYGLANVGQAIESTGLAGAGAQVGAGGIQQQYAAAPGAAPTSADVAYNLAQYQAAQAYPYQALAAEEGFITAPTSLSGGTSQTTTPPPNVFSQVAGLGIGAAGLGSLIGAVKSGGRVNAARGGVANRDRGGRHYTVPEEVLAHLIHRAWGGGIAGYADGGGGVGNMPYGGGGPLSYIPSEQSTHGSGPPKPPSPPQQPNVAQQMQQITALAKGLGGSGGGGLLTNSALGDSISDTIQDMGDGAWKGGGISNRHRYAAGGGDDSNNPDLSDWMMGSTAPDTNTDGLGWQDSVTGRIDALPTSPSVVPSDAPVPLPRPRPRGPSGASSTDADGNEVVDVGGTPSVTQVNDDGVATVATPSRRELPPPISDPIEHVPYSGLIHKAVDEYPDGFSPRGLSRTLQIESNYNPNDVSSTGAGGIAQFIKSTWNQFGGGGNRFNPQDAIPAAQKLAASNKAILENRIGRTPTDADIYLAHQQGAGGAAALLTHPDMRAGDVVGDQAIRVNGGNPNASAATFTNMWRAKFDRDEPVGGGGTSRVAYRGDGDGVGHRALGYSGDDVASDGVAPPSGGRRGLFGLTPEAATALMSAGFGMAAGSSPYFGINAGQAGLIGAQTYSNEMAQERAGRLSDRKLKLESDKLDFMERKFRAELGEKTREHMLPKKVGEIPSMFGSPTSVYGTVNPDGSIKEYQPRGGGAGSEFGQPQQPYSAPNGNPLRESPQPAPRTGGAQPVLKVAGQEVPPALTPPDDTAGRDEGYLEQVRQQNPTVAAWIKGLADYEMNPADLPVRGEAREKILGAVKMYDQNYDRTLYAGKQKSVNEFFAGGNTSPAGVLTAGYTAVDHLTELDSMVDKLRDGHQGLFGAAADWISGWNVPFVGYYAQKIKNAGLEGTAQGQDLSAYNDLRQRFTEEVTRFYSGGNGSEAERQRAIDVLDNAHTPEELHHAIATDVRAMNDKLEKYQSRLMAGMHPAAWKAALKQDPSILPQYKKSKGEINSIMAADAERQRVRGTGVITATPSAPAPGGGQPAAASVPAASLPPAAVSSLKEGVHTTFGNGQVWTLQGGKPVQVK